MSLRAWSSGISRTLFERKKFVNLLREVSAQCRRHGDGCTFTYGIGYRHGSAGERRRCHGGRREHEYLFRKHSDRRVQRLPYIIIDPVSSSTGCACGRVLQKPDAERFTPGTQAF